MGAESTLLIRGASWIYTCDRKSTVIEDGYILARGPRIIEIGPGPCPWTDADTVIDAPGRVVLPGLINTHHHFFQALTRAVPFTERCTSLDWLLGMYPLWSHIDEDAMEAACSVAVAELLLTGCTTSVDHSYLFPHGNKALLDIEHDVTGALGLRAHFVHGCIPQLEADLADRASSQLGFDPSALIEDEVSILESVEATIANYHDTGRYSMSRVGFGPTAVPFDRPKLLSRMAATAREAGCGLHTHLQPLPHETDKCRRIHGTSPVEFLRTVGWTGLDTWFAHGTRLDADDLRVLSDDGTGVTHCPRSSMRLGHRQFRLGEAVSAGVRVGIGIDGGASNDSGSCLGELRTALGLHRLQCDSTDADSSTWLGPSDILRLATASGADLLNRDDIGVLEFGRAADLCMFDLRKIGYAGALHDPLAGLLLAGDDTRADLTIVNGEVVVAHGALRSANERAIVERANAAAAALLDRAEAASGIDYRGSQFASFMSRGARHP